MTVLSILYEALRGKKQTTAPPRDVSLAGALTAGLYEVSQAMSTPAGDVQHSLDLIVSASASILRVERCALLLKKPREEYLVPRSIAGLPRGRQFDKYRQEIHDNIFAQILSGGEGMVVSEDRLGPERKLLRLMRRLDVRGFLAAPVKGSGGIVGILAAATPLDGRQLSDADLKLLSVMANFAAVALENAHLVSRLDRKARKIAAILEISRALNEVHNASVLFQLIVDRATELMGASSGSVILIDKESGVLRIEAERGLGKSVKEAMRLPVGRGITGWVASEGKPVLVPDVHKDPRYVEANPKVQSEMAVPIKWGNDVVGVLNLDHYEPEAFAEEDLELLSAFGNAAAVALRNVHILGEESEKS
ncbi:MAG TPA: GAF domain-containing protein [Candidatus Limnocylindrales bacterium]|nr:GAF domain-containing protein [Candidatus Limnocylindrales bacterium]